MREKLRSQGETVTSLPKPWDLTGMKPCHFQFHHNSAKSYYTRFVCIFSEVYDFGGYITAQQLQPVSVPQYLITTYPTQGLYVHCQDSIPCHRVCSCQYTYKSQTKGKYWVHSCMYALLTCKQKDLYRYLICVTFIQTKVMILKQIT